MIRGWGYLELSPLLMWISVLMSIMTIVMSIGSLSAPVFAAAQAGTRQKGAKVKEINSHCDIVLENITFAYPVGPDVKVLDGLSVRFPAGKRTAIVGASSSGKSTIVGLIERWYELDENLTDNVIVSLSVSEEEMG